MVFSVVLRSEALSSHSCPVVPSVQTEGGSGGKGQPAPNPLPPPKPPVPPEKPKRAPSLIKKFASKVSAVSGKVTEARCLLTEIRDSNLVPLACAIVNLNLKKKKKNARNAFPFF